MSKSCLNNNFIIHAGGKNKIELLALYPIAPLLIPFTAASASLQSVKTGKHCCLPVRNKRDGQVQLSTVLIIVPSRLFGTPEYGAKCVGNNTFRFRKKMCPVKIFTLLNYKPSLSFFVVPSKNSISLQYINEVKLGQLL